MTDETFTNATAEQETGLMTGDVEDCTTGYVEDCTTGDSPISEICSVRIHHIEGLSLDVRCRVRVGERGSSWDSKYGGTEYISEDCAASGARTPVNMIVPVHPQFATPNGEITVRVCHKDFSLKQTYGVVSEATVTFADALGHTASIPLQAPTALALDIQPGDKIKWMWGDAGTELPGVGKMGHALAKLNPLRWSGEMDPTAVVAALEADKEERPVLLEISRPGNDAKKVRFNTKAAVFFALKPQVYAAHSVSVSASQSMMSLKHTETTDGFKLGRYLPLQKMQKDDARLETKSVTSMETMPLVIGTAPLPPQLRGVFWLTKQSTKSALMSFGGPTRDAGGCSRGFLLDSKYKVRVGGDRVWSFSSKTKITDVYHVVKIPDLIYGFEFDDRDNPTHAKINPICAKWGTSGVPDFVMTFTMTLNKEGHESYPGSTVWQRESSAFGIELSGPAKYELVQVMDEHGNKIQPAWAKFEDFEASEDAGPDPGAIFYRGDVSVTTGA